MKGPKWDSRVNSAEMDKGLVMDVSSGALVCRRLRLHPTAAVVLG